MMDRRSGSGKPEIDANRRPSRSSNVTEQQHTFVVENLERCIRDSVRPVSTAPLSEEAENRRNSAQSCAPNSSSSLVPDPGILASLEAHAKTISANIDVLLRDLRGSLHGMSDLTVETAECFSDAISASCDSVDATIKNTYSLLAKVEELNEAMSGIRKLSQQVKDIKRVVDLFETQLLTDSTT